MTLRKGEKHTVESFLEFVDKLDVSDEEIIQALPTEKLVDMLDQQNTVRTANGSPPIEDPSEVEEAVLHGAARQWGLNSMIIDVLDARDREYVHMFDGQEHIIAELYPIEEEVQA